MLVKGVLRVCRPTLHVKEYANQKESTSSWMAQTLKWMEVFLLKCEETGTKLIDLNLRIVFSFLL